MQDKQDKLKTSFLLIPPQTDRVEQKQLEEKVKSLDVEIKIENMAVGLGLDPALVGLGDRGAFGDAFGDVRGR